MTQQLLTYDELVRAGVLPRIEQRCGGNVFDTRTFAAEHKPAFGYGAPLFQYPLRGQVASSSTVPVPVADAGAKPFTAYGYTAVTFNAPMSLSSSGCC